MKWKYTDELAKRLSEKKIHPIIAIDSINFYSFEDKNKLPSYYSLRDEMILPTENQDGFNCCWSFATLKCLQSAIQKQTGEFIDYSEAWLTLLPKIFYV